MTNIDRFEFRVVSHRKRLYVSIAINVSGQNSPRHRLLVSSIRTLAAMFDLIDGVVEVVVHSINHWFAWLILDYRADILLFPTDNNNDSCTSISVSFRCTVFL